MRILKILLISTALAAFGAGAALAATVPVATTPGDTESVTPPKTAKKKVVAKKRVVVKKRLIAKKHVAKKHVVTHKHPHKKKIVVAKAIKKKPAPSTDTETAPGSPPGSSPN